LYYLGRLAAARPHLERAIQLDDSLGHRSQPFVLGYSLGHSGVFSKCHLAFVRWLLGYPDQALRAVEEALALARELRHPQSLIYALHATCCVRQYRRETDSVGEAAQALVELASEYGFDYWRIYGDILLNWALTQNEGTSDRIARVGDDIAGILATGTRIAVPWLLSMLADLHVRAGQAPDALTVVVQALDLIESTGEREQEAELHRRKGVLLLAQGAADAGRGEACLRRALDIARGRDARSQELRAATSLAHLLAQEGQRDQAHALLAPVVSWFTEGLGTADLREATALLGSLARERLPSR